LLWLKANGKNLLRPGSEMKCLCLQFWSGRNFLCGWSRNLDNRKKRTLAI